MRLSMILATAILCGCASLGKEDDSAGGLTIAETSEIEFTPVAFEQATGLAEYDFGGAPQKAEWIDCKVKNVKGAPRATILVMHRDRAGFDDGKFCEGWIAQTFLGQGLDVITVNRPGYGKSTGVVDFSGAQSMAALAAGAKDALAKAKNAKPLDGIFGYSTGASAAALFAKKHLADGGALKYLILGGGIYDYEETLKSTTDDYIRKDIEQIQKTGGSTAMEERSVAYDVSGLPPTIAIYHGKQDTSAPLSQAKSFNDALESNGGYKVTWQVIDGVNHEMPWTHHRKILEVLGRSVIGK